MPHFSGPVLTRQFIIKAGMVCAATSTVGLVGSLFLGAWAQIPVEENPGLITQPPQPQTMGAPSPLKVKIEVVRPEVELLPSMPESMTFEEIHLENSTLLMPAEVAPISDKYRNRPLTSADIHALIQEIDALYEKKGYASSFVYVPLDGIGDHTLKLDAVESRFDHVSISGNRFFSDWLIKHMLGEDPTKPFNTNALADQINRLNQDYPLQIKTVVIAPNLETGKTEIKLEMKDKIPYQISPTFDNQGRPFIGLYRVGATLSTTNVLGLGDRMTTSYLHSQGTNAVLNAYTVPLDSRGDSVGFTYNFMHDYYRLGRLGQPNVKGTSAFFGPLVTVPLNKSRTLTADTSFMIRRNGTFTQEDFRTKQANTATLNLGVTFNKPDALGRTIFRYMGSGTHASFDRSHIEWRNEFITSRLLNLPFRHQLFMRSQVVYAPARLPIAQYIQLGGAYSVRGYNEGLILGEKGYLFNVEDRWPIPFLSRVSPWLDKRLQGATFVDLGQAWYNKEDPLFHPGVTNRSRNNFLIGTGVGLRYRLSQFVMGFVDLGVGLVNRSYLEQTAQPSVRVHLGVRSDLL